MTIHRNSVHKTNGMDVGLGCPIQWTAMGIPAVGTTDILATQTITAAGTLASRTFTQAASNFTVQPLHPRPIRFRWNATNAGTVGRVIARLYGWDFWGNVVREIVTRTSIGSADSQTSIRHLISVVFEINGTTDASVDVSLGFGLGIGSPVRLSDDTLTIGGEGGNRDILAIRNPVDDTAIAPDTIYANPYNTIIINAAPADVKLEIMSRYDELGVL